MEGNDNCNTPKTKPHSFQNLPHYIKALTKIPFPLVDRVAARSMDETELVEVRNESRHEMKKTLSWWDLIWFAIGAVIGAGIFVLTGLEAKTVAGRAVVLSFVIPDISAMLSVFCYTEFTVGIPVADTLLLCFFLPLLIG